MPSPRASLIRGVITDWGGVLTTPILTTVRAWIEADSIDWESYTAVMRPWVAGAYGTDGTPNPVHALERGECSIAEFENTLATRLLSTNGEPVIAAGLLRRMFAASVPVPAMYELIRALRGAGYGTALLSNSWGCDEYPRADFPALFDTVVISGEVGMRKPEPEIFRHAAATLGLDPRECVFIDDVDANVAAAVACGMTGVHHTDPASTVAALEELCFLRGGNQPPTPRLRRFPPLVSPGRKALRTFAARRPAKLADARRGGLLDPPSWPRSPRDYSTREHRAPAMTA
ncbi:MAG: HAD family phosphatase [Streptosporangiaceae bacterium]|nr:HAD family phosphatase [Streptosporangiaceae bacterium]